MAIPEPVAHCRPEPQEPPCEVIDLPKRDMWLSDPSSSLI